MNRLICFGLLLGGALAAGAAPLVNQEFTIKAGEEWEAPLRNLNHHYRETGSVLDVSAYLPRKPIGANDRIIIDRDGHFVLAADPAKPIRFFCSTDAVNMGVPKTLVTREQLDIYIRDLVVHGYNMIRIHINTALMFGMTKEAEFNPEFLAVFDYLVSRCREQGIYIMMNLMESRYGFFPYSAEPWGNPKPFNNRNHMDMRTALYFSKEARENWAKGVTALLTRANTLTGLAPKDDPVFLMLLGYNEQEFAFHYRDITPENQKIAIGPWHDFLKKRYADIAEFNRRKGTSYASFQDIPCYSVREKDADVNDFVYESSMDLLRFYRETLNRIGYRGLFSNYDFVKSLLYHFVRRECDYAGTHIYHDHPLGDVNEKAYNKQNSALEGGNFSSRELASVRIWRKPLVCSEYDMPFWNRYRYERAFVFGAYAAFQNVDVMAVWTQPTSRAELLREERPWYGGRIRPFDAARDPLSDASQLLTFFMYMRGDVAPAKHAVRIIAERESVFAKNPNAQPALEQTALALLVGYSQQSVDFPKEVAPAAANELLLPSLGGGESRIEGFFTETLGKTGNISDYVKLLKSKNLLPYANRTDGVGIYENETGELYLDSNRKFMTVDTPRLQGMCAPAGTPCRLPDFEVVTHDRDGNLSLVAVDGLKPIRSAKRLLLIRLTNALNSNMTFDDENMRRIVFPGVPPGLLQHSRFTVRIRNDRAAALKLHPLTLEGIRTGKTLSPVSVKEDFAEFSVETARDGNTVYFELAE